ncbi:hypothetical protein HDU93_009352 [Gonapodya sp. JEL0774]|nr:hypothetical protein HDU93_009352 [Gonapodya sp. JEL0774]
MDFQTPTRVPNHLEFMLREENIPTSIPLKGVPAITGTRPSLRPRAPPPPTYSSLPESENPRRSHREDDKFDYNQDDSGVEKDIRLCGYYGIHELGTVVSLSVTGLSAAVLTAWIGRCASEWGRLLMATPARRAALILSFLTAMISYSTLRQAVGLIYTSFHHKKLMAVRLARLLDLSPSPQAPAQPIHRILVLPACRNLVANAVVLECMRLGRNHDEVSVVVCDDTLEMSEVEEMQCLEQTRVEGADERMLEFVRVTPDGVGVPGWTTSDAGEDLGLGGVLVSSTSRIASSAIGAPGVSSFSSGGGASQMDVDSGNLTDSSASDSTVSGQVGPHFSNSHSRLLRLRALRELARLVRDGGTLIVWDVEHVDSEYRQGLEAMRYGDRERGLVEGEGDVGTDWDGWVAPGDRGVTGTGIGAGVGAGVGLKAVARVPQRDGEVMFERVWCTEGEVAFGGLDSRAVLAVKRA